MRVSLVLIAASLALAAPAPARADDTAPSPAARPPDPAQVERIRARLGALAATDACFSHLCYFDRRIESRSPGVRVGFSIVVVPVVPGERAHAAPGWCPIEVAMCDGRRLRTGSLFLLGSGPPPARPVPTADRPFPLPPSPVAPERAPVGSSVPAI